MSIRVILWVTTMIDIDCPTYQEGLAKNYYLNNGTTIKWWHGHGSFIDYTYPDALDWWHSQMDLVLDIGIDGWKCDGTDPYVFELLLPHGYGGYLTERDYADYYYRDFFYYTRTKNPESLIMSRPVDSFDNLLYIDFSPRDVVFSGWVGDQDPTFSGLQDALDNMIESAFQTYVNFGSDIGGYRGGAVRTQELFLRWAQLGAFVPLMENGGGGNHFPWLFEPANQTVAIYKSFVDIHYQLKPYFLSAGSTAYTSGVSVMTPMAYTVFVPDHSWDYLLWTDIFVAPIVETGLQRTVDFPTGNNWIYWFNTSRIYTGDTSETLTIQLSEFPVFHRAGSILPLYNDTHPYFHSALTALVHPIIDHEEKIVVRRWKASSTELSYTWDKDGFKFKATASDQPLVLVINGVISCPDSIKDLVYLDPVPRLSSLEEFSSLYGYHCDLSQQRLTLATSDSTFGSHYHLPELQTLYSKFT